MGDIGILNVGAGDTKLTFDKSNPAETIRAGRIVKDMLRRGYALLIEVGKEDDGRPRFQRVLDFNPDTAEYIIGDFDPEIAAVADAEERNSEEGREEETGAAAPAAAAGTAPRRGGRRKTKTISATGTRGVAVARSAGG